MLAIVSVNAGFKAMEWIVIWGAVSIVSAALAAIFAAQKNRSVSTWAAWCFLLPPLVVLIMLMPKNAGPRPPRKALDDLDQGGLL